MRLRLRLTTSHYFYLLLFFSLVVSSAIYTSYQDIYHQYPRHQLKFLWGLTPKQRTASITHSISFCSPRLSYWNRILTNGYHFGSGKTIFLALEIKATAKKKRNGKNVWNYLFIFIVSVRLLCVFIIVFIPFNHILN